MGVSGNTWVIVLAAGEGTRLAPLTRALYGYDLPKQFAVLAGEHSLLQSTVARALALTDEERILVVVSERFEALARVQLACHPRVVLVSQPGNRDTAPGILLPLSHVRAHAPDAHVVLLPADHHIPNEAPLVDALGALPFDPEAAGRITLIGVVPDHPETDYGFVVPGREHAEGVRPVRAFFEKPPADVAEKLVEDGALWNTFISAGSVEAFWKAATAHLPELVARFERYSHHVGHASEWPERLATYAGLPAANFSKHVLELASDLRVTAVDGTGWTDWGSPRRVFESLAGTPELRLLRDRMRHPAHVGDVARELDRFATVEVA